MKLSPADQERAMRVMAEIWAQQYAPLVEQATMLSIPQAAMRLGCSPNTVRKEFPLYKLGNANRVKLTDILAYFDRQSAGAREVSSPFIDRTSPPRDAATG